MRENAPEIWPPLAAARCQRGVLVLPDESISHENPQHAALVAS